MLNNTKDILTIKDLQKLLNIGKNTALRLVQSGDVEAFKVGRQWRVTRDGIYNLIETNTKQSPEEQPIIAEQKNCCICIFFSLPKSKCIAC